MAGASSNPTTSRRPSLFFIKADEFEEEGEIHVERRTTLRRNPRLVIRDLDEDDVRAITAVVDVYADDESRVHVLAYMISIYSDEPRDRLARALRLPLETFQEAARHGRLLAESVGRDGRLGAAYEGLERPDYDEV